MYTDSHSHLSFLDIPVALSEIRRGRQKGLSRWLLAGYDLQDWERQVLLQGKAGVDILSVFGIHPWVVIATPEAALENLFELLSTRFSESHVVGEMGLDFHRPQGKELRPLQEEYFRKQLRFAGKRPCVLHVVKAHGAALKILTESPGCRGWVHGFSGSWQVAQEYIAKGFLISVGRQVRNKNYKNLQEVIHKIEIESLLIESDAPCGPDVQESPEAIYFQVAQTVASAKGISVEQLLSACHSNMSKVLNG